MFSKQADRIHDVLMGNATELHKAQDLIDACGLILFENADAGVRVAHAEHAAFDQFVN